MGLLTTLIVALQPLRRADPGLFVGVSSEVAFNAGPDRAMYAATKAAGKALLDSVALEETQEHVRVVQVLPSGMVDTRHPPPPSTRLRLQRLHGAVGLRTRGDRTAAHQRRQVPRRQPRGRPRRLLVVGRRQDPRLAEPTPHPMNRLDGTSRSPTPLAVHHGHRPVIGLVDWRLPVPGPAAVRCAADAGADGLHVDLGGPGRAPRLDIPVKLREVASSADTTGVKILAVTANCLNDVGLTAAAGSADARRVLNVAARLLDTGQALGAPLVIIPSFGRSAVTDETGFARTCDVLTVIAARARAAGLILASENVLDPARARQLICAVGPERFRILLDCYNPVAAGLNPTHLVAALADVLADQIHLKDGPAGCGTPRSSGQGPRTWATRSWPCPGMGWRCGPSCWRTTIGTGTGPASMRTSPGHDGVPDNMPSEADREE